MKEKGIQLQLGTVVDGRRTPVEVNIDDLPNPHFAVLGLSGAGKSRLFTDIIRQWRGQGGGVTEVDPGDLSDDMLAHAARRAMDGNSTSALKRVHYFEPGNYAVTFGLDPFRFDPAKPIHPEHRDNAYRAWLHTTVAHIAELVQLKQGQTDFEQNARLQRVLTNVLTAVGIALDKSGRHLPLSHALVLLNTDDPLHQNVFELVAPHLDMDTLADFRRLHGYRRIEDRIRETESTINRLRAILNPIAKAIFAVTSPHSVANVREIILKREMQLWNLRPTEYFGHDAKRTFGQLIIHHVLQTMMALPRDMRVRHLLVIDEAGEFINEELLWGLGALRKTGLAICLAFQDLSSLKKRESVDLTAKVLSQCNIVCFEQSWPDDTELLARRLFSGNLDFTPLQHEVDRHDGYGWHRIAEFSFSVNKNRSWTESDAVGRSDTVGEQTGESEQKTNSWQKTSSNGTAHVDSHSKGSGTTENDSKSWHQSPILRGGRLVDTVRLGSGGNSTGRTESESDTESDTRTDSQSTAEGGSEAFTHSRSKTNSRSDTATHTAGQGGAEGESMTVSQKLVPLARIRTEKQKTGMLEQSVADQLEKWRTRIANLPKRRAILKLHGRRKAVEIKTRDVNDPFLSPKAQMRAIEWVKRELYQLHPYYFVPSFDPKDEEKLLVDFIESVGCPASPESDDTDCVENDSLEESPIL